MARLFHITKEDILQKNYTKTASWKLVLGPFVFPKIKARPLKNGFLKQATYIRYVI